MGHTLNQMQMEETHISNRGGWCSKRTPLEKILIATTIIICIVLLVYGYLLWSILETIRGTDHMQTKSSTIETTFSTIQSTFNIIETPSSTIQTTFSTIETISNTQETICNIVMCKNESSKILKYVDSSINPCENFYNFACGNYIKRIYRDADFDRPIILNDEEERMLIESYKGPILDKDHNMVKVAKKLFKACMNVSQMNGLETIKHVVESVGGWPVVEGSNWKEEDFDWVEVTYKLRKLGYKFNIFLDVDVVTDPTNSNGSILKVDLSRYDHHIRRYIADIAVEFGALYKELAKQDLMDTYYMTAKLDGGFDAHFNNPMRYKIGEYQRQCNIINWLEFINKIVGTTTQLSHTDLVIFPSPGQMEKWLKRIASVPKRAQANYMIWKVIEASLPFISIKPKKTVPSLSYCLAEVQKRFTPYSPIDVLFLRKYLPQQKKKAIEEIFSNIKEEFVANLKKHVNWIDAKDKTAVLERMDTVQLKIGLLGDYTSDQVLDDLNVDMITPKNDNLLNLIAQANRNHQTLLYSYVTNHKGRKVPNLKIVKAPLYLENDNVIFVPTISVKEALFDENRSTYLNYGALGTQIAVQFSSILTVPLNSAIEKLYNGTKLEIQEKVKCLKNVGKKYKVPDDAFYPTTMVRNNAGVKIAYQSYRKWVETHGEEKQLIGVDYTPNQIFWITSMLSFCKRDDVIDDDSKEKYFPISLMGSVRIVPEFARDFKCSNTEEMDASTECELF